jgi:uncharacterized protein (TIGR02217 family)
VSFHDVSFPDAIARGATGGPEYSTDVVMVASGFEQRNVNWSAARARYDISTGIRTREQMAEVVAFFRARKGRAYGFRFRDWSDFEAVDQTCQEVTSTVFQLVKRYPSGPVQEVRTITRPVSGTVVVKVNGVVVAPTIDHATGRLTFGAPPAATPVASFQFDVPVRFDADHLQVVSAAYHLQNVQSIPLVEIRA